MNRVLGESPSMRFFDAEITQLIFLAAYGSLVYVNMYGNV